MILVDDRIGSKHYADLIGDKATITRLESADIAFDGNGVTVGIEIKKVSDALSCMFSSRLADTQLPLMAQQYDVRYLIVEELYRAEPSTGVLQRWRPFPSQKDTVCGRWYDAHAGRNRVMHSAFEMWLHTMSELSQTRLERTADAAGTVSLVLALYAWWQRGEHHSFNVMYEGTGEAAVLSRPTMLRRMIALLPRVGWSRSGELVKRFTSPKEMVLAPPEAWLIPNEIAMGTAVKIVEALSGSQLG